MKVHRKHKNLKERIKAARETGRIEGELKATKQYNKSLRKLAAKTGETIVTLEGAHEASLALSQRKEEEFTRKCGELDKKIEKVNNILRDVEHHETEGKHHVKKVRTIYNDEKREKFGNLNHSENEMDYHFNQVRKKASSIGIN